MNVLYFVTHDTGRFLGAYRPQIRFTPNLDRFAAGATRFDGAFCSAPCCGPSRVCAMTGKYSRRTGTLGLGSMGWLLPSGESTLVDDFNAAGYQTMHAGFCHERLYGKMRYECDGVPGADESWWQCDTRLVVDKAIHWLESARDRSRPFYMNLATNETHASHFAGKFTAGRHGGQVPLDEVWIPPAWPEESVARDRFANWYASLRYMDHHFGRLMEALDRLGLRDETMVVYTTDHGIGGLRGKRFVYDLGVEIALLVRMPGQTEARCCDALIPNIDFRPTWLEACGLAAPEGIDGRSFWPLLAGGGYRPHEHLFIERNFHGEPDDTAPGGHCDFYDPQRAIRTRDWHYVRNLIPDKRLRPSYAWEVSRFQEDPRGELDRPEPPDRFPRPAEELYHVRGDAWELFDLADRPGAATIKADLAAKLDRWMRETDDPALRPGIPPALNDPAIWPVAGKTVPIKRL